MEANKSQMASCISDFHVTMVLAMLEVISRKNYVPYIETSVRSIARPLCCQCQSGLHVLTYSLNLPCTECSNGSSDWWKYVLRGFLPPTFFYTIIICLKINIPSSQLQAYVLSTKNMLGGSSRFTRFKFDN